VLHEAADVARSFAARALEALAPLPASAPRESLCDLAEYVLIRVS